jgi:hypothetical protein
MVHHVSAPPRFDLSPQTMPNGIRAESPVPFGSSAWLLLEPRLGVTMPLLPAAPVLISRLFTREHRVKRFKGRYAIRPREIRDEGVSDGIFTSPIGHAAFYRYLACSELLWENFPKKLLPLDPPTVAHSTLRQGRK